jgi:hypothetical protein
VTATLERFDAAHLRAKLDALNSTSLVLMERAARASIDEGMNRTRYHNACALAWLVVAGEWTEEGDDDDL